MSGLPPRPLASKGERPYFLDNPETERLFNMVLALAGEVSALSDSLDTVARLSATGEAFTMADVETYQPDDEVREFRQKARSARIQRVFRILMAEAEREGDRLESYQEVMSELARDKA